MHSRMFNSLKVLLILVCKKHLWVSCCISVLLGKCSSLVAHWLLVSRKHGSIPGGGIKMFLLCFWVGIKWLQYTIELIHDCARLLFNELIHHVWLSIRLYNLIARHETNWNYWTKKCCLQFFTRCFLSWGIKVQKDKKMFSFQIVVFFNVSGIF